MKYVPKFVSVCVSVDIDMMCVNVSENVCLCVMCVTSVPVSGTGTPPC